MPVALHVMWDLWVVVIVKDYDETLAIMSYRIIPSLLPFKGCNGKGNSINVENDKFGKFFANALP